MSEQALKPPASLAARPAWKGMPIPYTVIMRKGGIPDFAVTDLRRWIQVVRQRLCGLCGDKLDKEIYFIGGPLCAENRLFGDPAMHKDCARYAFSVCPYLAFRKDFDPEPEKRPTHLEIGVSVDDQISPTRPDRFALYRCRSYELAQVGERTYLRPEPATGIEWIENKAARREP